MSITILIADCQPKCSEVLSHALGSEPDFEVIHDPESGNSTLQALEKLQPDALFVDVQGDWAKEHKSDLKRLAKIPKLVGISADRAAAIQAFEIGAIDFLPEIPSVQELSRVISRLRYEIETGRAAEIGKRVLGAVQVSVDRPPPLTRLIFKCDGRIVFLESNHVDRIESEGNYIKIFAGKECYFVRETISQMEKRLDPSRFIRIHRTVIVNLRAVQEIIPWGPRGESVVLLRDGTKLNLGPTYRSKLLQMVTTG